MKVIGITGSPRKDGNTDQLVKEVLKGAESVGAKTSFYRLDEMNVKGCKSCYYCMGTGKCAQKDDMQQIYADMADADTVVIGSPVYMWQMTSQTKAFVDRLLTYLNPNYTTRNAKGTKIILAYTQGQKETEAFMSYFQHTSKMLEFLGFPVKEILVAGGTSDKNDIQKQPETLKKAFETGSKVCACNK